MFAYSFCTYLFTHFFVSEFLGMRLVFFIIKKTLRQLENLKHIQYVVVHQGWLVRIVCIMYYDFYILYLPVM